MNVKRLQHDIYEISSFVSEADNAAIMGMATKISLWNSESAMTVDDFGNIVHDPDDWKEATCGADILFDIDPLGYLTLENVARDVMAKAESLFACKLSFREPALVRYREGFHQGKLHADKHNLDGSPKLGMENYDISAVIYHNDEFTGGDLVFVQHDVRISPRARNVVIFPGAVTHLHYVDAVASGVRWSSPLFFSIIN